MNISFDLDSTLIPNGNEFRTEKRSQLAKFFGVEEIRKGARELINDLKKQGHFIHIYTTSFRSKARIRCTLLYYGITVERIVNQKENQKTLSRLKINSSKYPKAFDFDLHVDDSKGVGIEANRFNFKVIVVESGDDNWIQKIKIGIQEIKESSSIEN